MNQKGFTLIELMLAMAVSGMVLVGIVLAIHQVVWGSSRSNSQVIALTDVNHAALWIKHDLQSAQSTSLTDGDPPPSSVTLDWIDCTAFAPEEARNHSCTYSLSGTELQRNYDGTVSVVGRHITSLGFTQNNRVVTVVVTATGPGVPQRNETVSFSILTRTEEVQ